MFEAEAIGLRQMQATRSIRVPAPICYGTSGDTGYIVLEWIDLGRGNSQAWEVMGRQLAAMHQSISDRGLVGSAITRSDQRLRSTIGQPIGRNFGLNIESAINSDWQSDGEGTFPGKNACLRQFLNCWRITNHSRLLYTVICGQAMQPLAQQENL